VTAPFAYRSRQAVSSALKTYLAVLGSLWSIALLFAAVRGIILHQGYPFNTFLFQPSLRFSDFTVYDPRFAVWGQGDQFFSLRGFKFDYPAPMLLGQLAYYKLSPAPLYTYLGTVVLFALTGGLLAAMVIPKHSRVRWLAAAAAVSTAVFSFPLFFLIDRANIEGLVWIATSLGLAFFATHRYARAALLLALAASMKIFPGVLLLLLLARKRYRDFCIALAAIGVFTCVSLWVTGPTTSRAAQGIMDGLAFLRQVQIFEYRPVDISFDHSLFAFVKQVCFRVFHDIPRVKALLPQIYLVYGLLSGVVFAAIYVKSIRRLPVLNQILTLTSFSILLPYVSFDYTLLHLFVPFTMLMLVLATDGADGRLRLTKTQLMCLLVPYAVLFTPQSYLVYHVVGYGAQVKTLALCALIVAAIRIPLPSTLFKELRSAETLWLELNLAPTLGRSEQEYALAAKDLSGLG
jgi:hypothetical protein